MSRVVPDRLEAEWYTRLRVMLALIFAVCFGAAAAVPGFAERGVINAAYGHAWAIAIYAAIGLGSAGAIVALALDKRGVVYLLDAANTLVAASTVLAYTHDPRPSAIVAFVVLMGLSVLDVLEIRDARDRPSA